MSGYLLIGRNFKNTEKILWNVSAQVIVWMSPGDAPFSISYLCHPAYEASAPPTSAAGAGLSVRVRSSRFWPLRQHQDLYFLDLFRRTIQVN
jgi:hypothetical protein